MSAELLPYLMLVLVGFLPTEIWRMLGLDLVHRIEHHHPL